MEILLSQKRSLRQVFCYVIALGRFFFVLLLLLWENGSIREEKKTKDERIERERSKRVSLSRCGVVGFDM